MNISLFSGIRDFLVLCGLWFTCVDLLFQDNQSVEDA